MSGSLFDDSEPSFDPERLTYTLGVVSRELNRVPDNPSGVPARTLAKIRDQIKALSEQLTTVNRKLDPVRHTEVFDPTHPHSAADLIAERLLRQQRRSLGGLERFYGAGVYALYYNGDHPAYAIISRTEIPIYVGKAESGELNASSSAGQGEKLYDRLIKDHARSIRSAERHTTENPENCAEAGVFPIALQDFECRFLVLASAYAGAVERNIINHYLPVWNKEAKVCIGFGKHGDAADTRANTRSDWDTIHPGRPWATRDGNVPNRLPTSEIQARILSHSRRIAERLAVAAFT